LDEITVADIPRKFNKLTPLTWSILKNEIQMGRPIYIDWGGHASVICGYIETTNPSTGNIKKTVIVSDPWPERDSRYLFEEFSKKLAWYILLPDKPIEGREQEVVMDIDIDEDGIIGFDEDYRFCSVFFNADTDEDGVPDKQEIRSYTFHDQDFGGHNNDALTFPDIDDDGKRAECDCDSDNGGMIDGWEDANQNGVYEPGETDVYFAADDFVPFWDFVEPFPYEYEMVYIWGENFKPNTSFNYEVLSECGIPLNDYSINASGSFITDANGHFYNHPIDFFPEGLFEVIIDINDNLIFDEECGDLRKCFIVVPDEEFGCCWHCDEEGVVLLGVTEFDCLNFYSTPEAPYLWHPGPCNPPESYSCDLFGCTNPCATNYNPLATQDDGSCIPPDTNCNTDPCFGDVQVYDDTLCTCVTIVPQVLGCTDSTATNYNPEANCNDNSCIYGCCICCSSEGELIYNISNIEADCLTYPGFNWVEMSCAEVPDYFTCPIFGCTDSNACNYDDTANQNDGSCDYSCQCFPSLQLSGNIPSSEYHSSSIIQSNAIIDSGKTVKLYAPDCIHLDSGTSIKAGSSFKVKIEDCAE